MRYQTQNVKYMYSCQIPTSLFNVGYSGGDVTVRTCSRLCSIPSWTIYPIVQIYPALLFFGPGIFRWPEMLHICIHVTAPLDPIRTLGTPNVKYIYPWQIPPKTIMILGHRQPKSGPYSHPKPEPPVNGNPKYQIYASVTDPYPTPSGTSVTGNPKCQIYASVSDPHPNPPRPCQKYMWRKTKFRQVPSWKLYVGIIKKMRCGDGFSENIFFHITKIWKYMSSIAGVVGDGCCGSCAASNLSKVIAFDINLHFF